MTFVAAASLFALAIIAGGGIAAASGGGGSDNDGDDQPLTGDTYTQAVEAALAHTGGGEVTETEIGDDGAAYEVEIRLSDGSEVEVELDDGFNVIGSEPDDDADGDSDDGEGDNDD